MRVPALFPSFVSQHSVCFHAHDDSDLARQFPGIRLPASLASASPRERVEQSAVRFCAEQALRACAPELGPFEVEIGAHREPRWPPGVVGAISHTHGFASAVVARTRDASAVGFDAERVTHLGPGALDYIALPAEVEALALSSRMTSDSVASIVYSAKEALFKCLYAEVGRYFDFRDAVIDVLDAERGQLNARLLVDLSPRLIAGTCFLGRFAHGDGRVYTAFLLEP